MTGETNIEYKLLASFLLLGKAEREKIMSAADEESFQSDGTKSIFRSFCDVFRRFPDADDSAFVSALNDDLRKNLLEAINGMMSPGIAENQLDDTLGAFREQCRNRRKSEIVTGLALSENVSAADIHKAADDIQKLEAAGRKNTAQEYLLHYSENIKTVPTGFEKLDEILGGGFIAGTLVTIGARPSTGKTTYAINIASHNPERKILMFSIEMTSRMIYDRLVADQLMLDYSLCIRHALELRTVKMVIDTFRDFTVIDDISHIEDICDIIREEKPEMVIIDFIQIITSRKKFVDNRQRIDYISGMLKATAKSTKTCIITLSQITRNGKDKPTMSDLKESGGLEQDSDYVLIMHRPYVNDKSNDEISPSQTTVTLDKNKFGNTRELKYGFDGRIQRFTESGEETQGIAHPAKPSHEAAESDLPF